MLIYRITNKLNGKVYIGKTTVSLSKRWKWHRNSANQAGRFYFARAIRKYGPKAFVREVIYHAKTLDELSKMETFFIILHQSHIPENGYNGTLGGEGATLVTEETRRRMGEVRRGIKFSPEHCKHIGDSKRGAKNPWFGRKRPKVIAAMHRATDGKPLSAVHREKLSKAHQGKTLSGDHRRALSEAHKGIVFSEEHRKNLSLALSGERNAGYGTRWIRRGTETMRIPAQLLNSYVGQGWQPGRAL